MKTHQWILIGSILFFQFSADAVVDGNDLVFAANRDEDFIQARTVKIFGVKEGGRIKQLCTGTIRNGGQIVTAAHCLDDGIFQNNGFQARGLYIEVFDPANPHKMKRYNVSSGRRLNNAYYDLALLNVEGSLPVTSELPIATAGCDDSQSKILVGFGLTESNNVSSYPRTSVVNEIRMPNYRRQQIRDRSRDLAVVHGREYRSAVRFGYSEEVIANYNYRGNSRACFGDSGGPIFCRSQGRMALAGVTASIAEPSKFHNGEKVQPSEYCRDMELVSSASAVGVQKALTAWDAKEAEEQAEENRPAPLASTETKDASDGVR